MSIFSSTKDVKPEAPRTSSPNPISTPTPSSHGPSPSSSGSLGRVGTSTLIAQGTQVDGNLKVEGNIQIEGVVKGTLTSKGKVVIGNSGTVHGDVLCQHAEISGKIDGKLKIAEILFLKSSAKIDGDIQTGKLVMESGVQFNGNCSMGTAATVPASTPKPAATPSASSSSSSSSSSSAGSSSAS